MKIEPNEKSIYDKKADLIIKVITVWLKERPELSCWDCKVSATPGFLVFYKNKKLNFYINIVSDSWDIAELKERIK